MVRIQTHSVTAKATAERTWVNDVGQRGRTYTVAVEYPVLLHDHMNELFMLIFILKIEVFYLIKNTSYLIPNGANGQPKNTKK